MTGLLLALAPLGAAVADGGSRQPGDVPFVPNDPSVGAIGQAPPMSTAMAAADSAKTAQDQSVASSGGASPDSTCGTCTGGAPDSYYLAKTQEDQANGSWCGPATIAESLRQVSGATDLTQSQAAYDLGTDYYGETPWSGDGYEHNVGTPMGYPMPDVMNHNTPAGVHYVAHAVGSVTSTEIDNYKINLEADVGLTHRPVIGDQWVTSTSEYFLAGEPHSYHMHWWNIRGYSGSGGTTYYEDSAFTAYGNTTATAVVTMVSGRGYVY
ncbi:MAG TPA: hypothetical protein VFI30_08350 [Nocardioidaceae bacterium]|nr:hypothetical protein [Nocardioidaceae bacterium]